jgi:uncharacterized protein
MVLAQYKKLYSEVSVWRYQPKSANEQRVQIDMLIDRADRCINLCEMKFASGSFEITKSYAKELDNKLKIFQAKTETRKSLFTTMMTMGLKIARAIRGLYSKKLLWMCFSDLDFRVHEVFEILFCLSLNFNHKEL